MERVAIEAVAPDAVGSDSVRRRLSERLDTAAIAINHYRIAPGEALPGGLHAHADQEEVFVVLEGSATFETLRGEVCVDSGEVVRFAPGEFQSGINASADELVVLAVGAPPDPVDTRIPVACPACGHGDLRVEVRAGGPTFVCPDCGAEHVPRDCPECGHDDLRVTLAEEAPGTVVACHSCEAEFDSPPLQ